MTDVRKRLHVHAGVVVTPTVGEKLDFDEDCIDSEVTEKESICKHGGEKVEICEAPTYPRMS